MQTLAIHENDRAEVRLAEVAYTLSTGGGKPGQGYPAVLIASIRGELKSGTLTAHYAKSMNSTLDEPVVIMNGEGQIIATANGVAVASCVTGHVTHTLTSEGADASEDGTGRGTPIIAFDWQTSGSERTRPNISTERTSAIQCTNRDALLVDLAVRRLTPMECERLQGFPDDHTTGQSNSTRYRQLGNAVAVPVVEWIAKRMVGVDDQRFEV